MFAFFVFENLNDCAEKVKSLVSRRKAVDARRIEQKLLDCHAKICIFFVFLSARSLAACRAVCSVLLGLVLHWARTFYGASEKCAKPKTETFTGFSDRALCCESVRTLRRNQCVAGSLFLDLERPLRFIFFDPFFCSVRSPNGAILVRMAVVYVI